MNWLERHQLVVAIVALSVIAGLTAIGPLYRAKFLAEIDVNEGWVAYHVDAILHGRPLYPSPDQLITNNYPPLFFYLEAALAQLTGSALYAGRALSFAALLLISLEIFSILRNLGVRRLFAFVSAIATFATMSRLFDGKVAVNDPQMVAHAAMMFGLYCFVRERAAHSRWFALSAAVMVTAGFVKHNLFAVPLAAFLILARDDRRSALRFALLGAALAAAGLSICAAIYGPDFAYNMLSPRPYHWARGFKALEDMHRVPVQFMLWIWFALAVRDGDRGRLINVLCLVALVESFIVRGGEEVDKNAGFDLVIALHLALGVVLERATDLRVAWLQKVEARTAVVVVIAVRLLFGEPMDSFNVLYRPEMARRYQQAERATADEIDRIARIPGPMFCPSLLPCYLAGKPFTIDPVNLGFRIGTGRVSCDVLARQLVSGSLTLAPTADVNLRPYGERSDSFLGENPFGKFAVLLEPTGRYLSPPSTALYCKQ